MLNGRTTRSPFRMLVTASPTSVITPMISWPTTFPGWSAVRPSYMWRSLPQIAAVVTRSTASLGPRRAG
jgi:hypothetical protein